jgi:glycosyltransferase involved in cell wall biosynthesis
MSAPGKPHVLIIGTDPDGMGGVASVFQAYRAGGLQERWPVDHLVTHVDGDKWRKLLVFLRSLLVFAGWMLRGKGQILHIHTSSRASFYRKATFVWLGRLCRRKVILHLHGAEFMLFYRQEAGQLVRALIQRTFAATRRTVVLASQWLELAREFAPGADVVVLHNPMILPADPPDTAGRDEATLLFLGRVGQRKGAWDLFEVLAELCPSHPRLRLWMGGDGELDEARRRLDALGIADRVELKGWLRGPAKEDLLRHASIYVLPSYNEGLPMGVLEAMAWGLPVISTDVGGTRDAIPDDTTGILIRPGDRPALRDALRDLLADPGRRRELGEHASRRIREGFSARTIVEQVIRLYSEVRPTSR